MKDEFNDFEAFVDNQEEIEHNFHSLNNTFADGAFDAAIGDWEPTKEQWLSADYRAGFLSRLESRLNDKYGVE